jgi:hypothetical protein
MMAGDKIKVSYSDVINAQQKIHDLSGCWKFQRLCMYRDKCQSNSCFNEYVKNRNWANVIKTLRNGIEHFNVPAKTAERIRQINGPYGNIIYKAWLVQEEERLKHEQEVKTYNAQTNARLQKSSGEG